MRNVKNEKKKKNGKKRKLGLRWMHKTLSVWCSACNWNEIEKR
jgi:hypothetical protein